MAARPSFSQLLLFNPTHFVIKRVPQDMSLSISLIFNRLQFAKSDNSFLNEWCEWKSGHPLPEYYGRVQEWTRGRAI